MSPARSVSDRLGENQVAVKREQLDTLGSDADRALEHGNRDNHAARAGWTLRTRSLNGCVNATEE